MREVRWTETAKKTLRETSDFILDLWNIQVNENFLDQLEYRIGQLQNNPKLGPIFGNTNYRKLVINKPETDWGAPFYHFFDIGSQTFSVKEYIEEDI